MCRDDKDDSLILDYLRSRIDVCYGWPVGPTTASARTTARSQCMTVKEMVVGWRSFVWFPKRNEVERQSYRRGGFGPSRRTSHMVSHSFAVVKRFHISIIKVSHVFETVWSTKLIKKPTNQPNFRRCLTEKKIPFYWQPHAYLYMTKKIFIHPNHKTQCRVLV